MPNHYDLIIFDWDCTLMDSAARIVHCLQQAANTVNQPIPNASAIRHTIGLGLPEAIRHVFGSVNDAVSANLITAYRDHWHDHQIAASALFPGAINMLKTLQAEGYLLAIATGKGRQGLNQALQDTQLTDFFQATRCADECLSKPNPQMIQEIIVDLDTTLNRTLMVGDTTYDMQMAANAKVDAIGVSYGVHAPAQLTAEGALAIVETLSEIPNWLHQTKTQVTRQL
jgi:phosphoglycolate phosphatase